MKEKQQFTIHTNKEKLDIDVIYSYLHHQSYWAKGIPLHLVQTSIEHSVCFGVYDECDKQVGFGRIISDFARLLIWRMCLFFRTHEATGLEKRWYKK